MEDGMRSTVLFEHSCRHAPLLKKEKRGSIEKPRKLELVGYDALPKYLKHNEFILGYYRCDWPLKDAIRSIFSIHNETINVWTHVLGFFVFLTLTLYAANMVPTFVDAMYGDQSLFSPMNNATRVANRHEEIISAPPRYLAFLAKFITTNEKGTSLAELSSSFVQPISGVPLFAFLCGAMFCLLTSSCCHLLSCHSELTSYVLLHLDFAGISALIVTSILPQVYYTFACDSFYRNVYTVTITALGLLTVAISLIPVFETPEYRFVRSLVFVFLSLSGWAPIVHKLMIYGNKPAALVTTLYELLMYCCYGAGVVIYALRIPERWMPGKFDLIGHSHQLFHLLVIAGAYIQYLAILVYLQWRDAEAC